MQDIKLAHEYLQIEYIINQNYQVWNF